MYQEQTIKKSRDKTDTIQDIICLKNNDQQVQKKALKASSTTSIVALVLTIPVQQSLKQ